MEKKAEPSQDSDTAEANIKKSATCFFGVPVFARVSFTGLPGSTDFQKDAILKRWRRQKGGNDYERVQIQNASEQAQRSVPEEGNL